MANVHTVDQLNSSFHFLGDFCQIKVIFKDKTANAPVHVFLPTFKIIKDKTTLIEKGLVPTGIKQGEFKVTFDSNQLTELGIYDLTFEAYYPDNESEGNKITISSKFELFDVDSNDVLISILRTQLHDHRPDLYWLDNTIEYKWEDTDIYNALQRAVDYWNMTPPVSLGNSQATVQNFPFRGILINAGEWYALNSKYNLENWNQIQYSDDTTLNINRAPGIMQKIQLLQTWMNEVPKIKKDYTTRTAQGKGIKSIRIPTRALRNLSFTPQFSFLSSAGY